MYGGIAKDPLSIFTKQINHNRLSSVTLAIRGFSKHSGVLIILTPIFLENYIFSKQFYSN